MQIKHEKELFTIDEKLGCKVYRSCWITGNASVVSSMSVRRGINHQVTPFSSGFLSADIKNFNDTNAIVRPRDIYR